MTDLLFPLFFSRQTAMKNQMTLINKAAVIVDEADLEDRGVDLVPVADEMVIVAVLEVVVVAEVDVAVVDLTGEVAVDLTEGVAVDSEGVEVDLITTEDRLAMAKEEAVVADSAVVEIHSVDKIKMGHLIHHSKIKKLPLTIESFA